MMFRDADQVKFIKIIRKLGSHPHADKKDINEFRKTLDKLEAYLDDPTAKKKDLSDSGICYLGNHFPLESAELNRIYTLHQRVVERRGSGAMPTEESLLKMVAVSANPSSIPFWLKVLNLKLPNDRFSKERKELAMAGLYYLAFHCAQDDALNVIFKALSDPVPYTRLEALKIIERAHIEGKLNITPTLSQELSDIAAIDADFEVRYTARRLLSVVGNPLPLENSGGTYFFKVRFSGSSWYRVVELKSEQTLDDLHYAIQKAIDWDADHLYRFMLNGKFRDDTFAIVCPYEDKEPTWISWEFEDEDKIDEEVEMNESVSGEQDGIFCDSTSVAVLGQLAFIKGHKFLYLFDYGDDHVFEIRVTTVNPKAESGEYPRLVESVGDAPEQYPRWGNEWE